MYRELIHVHQSVYIGVGRSVLCMLIATLGKCSVGGMDLVSTFVSMFRKVAGRGGYFDEFDVMFL